MYCTKPSLLLFGLLWVCGLCRGQERLTAYWQPQFSVNYGVATNYSHNFSLTNRNFIFEDEAVVFRGRQLDLAHFSKLKIRDNQSIALGLQYRFRKLFEKDRGNEFRLTQQYNLVQKPNIIRFGHRLRTEQRIFESLTVHRFRYRFALDRPLQGEKLDVGEAYFIASLESLLSVAKAQSPQLDERLTFQLGWLLNQKTRLQTGVEYRWEDFTQERQDVLFLLSSLVISL
ncbi:DUF2490 domain-containing protein [Poritiphilus flavus]|uniref:DUF2490 domain-containing protein n=1 Tax=Poritiphilus flavus TaxID=2697053 RepID=A0A6L9EDE2_9FLAO|nr:DUF2490 domain-containing protein [Poritiphilus flavus]NAS12663.1 DUF2490 domain-containing protein [Poritiphilus flavus]